MITVTTNRGKRGLREGDQFIYDAVSRTVSFRRGKTTIPATKIEQFSLDGVYAGKLPSVLRCVAGLLDLKIAESNERSPEIIFQFVKRKKR